MIQSNGSKMVGIVLGQIRYQRKMLGTVSVSDFKREWRHKILSSMLAMKTPDDCTSSGHIIFETLSLLKSFQNAQTISIFISKHPEIDTQPLINKFFDTNKTCLLPSWTKSEMKMVQTSKEEYLELIKSRKSLTHIPMPPFPEYEPAIPIDLVILPGLVLNRQGVRIGYGFGCYDRYLSKLIKTTRTRPLLIGICHDIQLVDASLPEEPFDQLVDFVITPSVITRCNPHLDNL